LKKHYSIKMNIPLKQIDMSTTAATQPILTIVKDEFAEVITEGTLSPTNKPTDWNIVITKKALLKAIRIPSPPPEEIQHGLATLYNNTFLIHEEYCEFTVNCLTVTTLILNKYQQSSNSSVQAFEFKVSRTTQNAYC
jgi:hypothetical protein